MLGALAASCTSSARIPDDAMPCVRAGMPDQDTVVCALDSEDRFIALAIYRKGDTYLRKAPGLSALSGTDRSASGRYMFIITTGEGHPWLDVIDIGEIATSGVKGHPDSIARVDPYPGWVDGRWEGDELIVESDVDLLLEGEERESSANDDRIYMFRLDLLSNDLEPVGSRPY